MKADLYEEGVGCSGRGDGGACCGFGSVDENGVGCKLSYTCGIS